MSKDSPFINAKLTPIVLIEHFFLVDIQTCVAGPRGDTMAQPMFRLRFDRILEKRQNRRGETEYLVQWIDTARNNRTYGPMWERGAFLNREHVRNWEEHEAKARKGAREKNEREEEAQEEGEEEEMAREVRKIKTPKSKASKDSNKIQRQPREPKQRARPMTFKISMPKLLLQRQAQEEQHLQPDATIGAIDDAWCGADEYDEAADEDFMAFESDEGDIDEDCPDNELFDPIEESVNLGESCEEIDEATSVEMEDVDDKKQKGKENGEQTATFNSHETVATRSDVLSSQEISEGNTSMEEEEEDRRKEEDFNKEVDFYERVQEHMRRDNRKKKEMQKKAAQRNKGGERDKESDVNNRISIFIDDADEDEDEDEDNAVAGAERVARAEHSNADAMDWRRSRTPSTPTPAPRGKQPPYYTQSAALRGKRIQGYTPHTPASGNKSIFESDSSSLDSDSEDESESPPKEPSQRQFDGITDPRIAAILEREAAGRSVPYLAARLGGRQIALSALPTSVSGAVTQADINVMLKDWASIDKVRPLILEGRGEDAEREILVEVPGATRGRKVWIRFRDVPARERPYAWATVTRKRRADRRKDNEVVERVLRSR